MQHIAPSPPLRTTKNQVLKPAFSVITLHDGFFTGIRAMEALERLKFTLCPELQLYPVSWSFEKLVLQDVRATSVRAAAAADLLIVSAADETPLPDHIKLWFDSIEKQQRDTRPVIVALHEEGFESKSADGPLCTHLREVADTWQTAFMCNDDFDLRLDCDFATQLIISRRPTCRNRVKPFGGEFQSAPRYWGING